MIYLNFKSKIYLILNYIDHLNLQSWGALWTRKHPFDFLSCFVTNQFSLFFGLGGFFRVGHTQWCSRLISASVLSDHCWPPCRVLGIELWLTVYKSRMLSAILSISQPLWVLADMSYKSINLAALLPLGFRERKITWTFWNLCYLALV